MLPLPIFLVVGQCIKKGCPSASGFKPGSSETRSLGQDASIYLCVWFAGWTCNPRAYLETLISHWRVSSGTAALSSMWSYYRTEEIGEPPGEEAYNIAWSKMGTRFLGTGYQEYAGRGRLCCSRSSLGAPSTPTYS